jgi:G:T/U-mismatch repair DNA glycosylase
VWEHGADRETWRDPHRLGRAPHQTISDGGRINGCIVKKHHTPLVAASKLSRARASSCGDIFYKQTDAHIQQVLLMHLKALYHEERRHARVTS